MTTELILGGARSGKSALAQQRARDSGAEVIFVATASAGDHEMAERIRRHRADRPAHWTVVEEPVALADLLARHAADGRCVLVDCLTLWLCNFFDGEDFDEDGYRTQRDALLDALPRLPGHVILVSNELGLGVTPMGAMNRRFVDEAGRLHQRLATLCERVTLTVAGLPMTVKPAESA